MYTKAISINNTESVYFSNRAKALKMLNRLKEAKEDCVEAIELDNSKFRAYLIYGQILCKIGRDSWSAKDV